MTIRAKLYAAIVLTVLGPLATTAVALHGMAQMGDRFDEVRERAEREAVARELKFLVSEVNSWQTAYGYGDGEFRDRFVATADALEQDLDEAVAELTDATEQELIDELAADFGVFMDLDRDAWQALQDGQADLVQEILLGPEIERFLDMAASADELASYEVEQAVATEQAFDDARDDARRRLVAVALGAGLVIILLLVTANDIARMALEEERRRRDSETSTDSPS